MPFFEGIILYGLTPEFGRAMRIFAVVFAAIYLIYPLVMAVAWFAWRKGRARMASALVAATLGLGLGVPLIDQALHSADKRAILAAEVHGDRLDVAGKHVVVLRRVCADMCKWLLRYGDVERVTLVDASQEARAIFAQTGHFPLKTEAFSMRLDGLKAIKTPINLETLQTGDTLVIRRDPGWLSEYLPNHLPGTVAPKHIRISTYVAPANWGRPLDAWTPEILTLIHRDQAFLLPLHPFARTNRPTADFDAESRYLSDLLCPWPHGRFGMVCSQNAKP